MDELFAAIASERRELADVLDGLTDAQWSTPSLCRGWRVREVVAHLLMPFELSLPRMVGKMVGNRFDFDRVSDRWAKADDRPNAELVAVLRANAEHRFTPPGFGPQAPLTDVIVHGQDIKRPLGLVTAVKPDHARVVLDLLVSKKAKALAPKGLAAGLQLDATDAAWRHGDGPTVRGTADALITVLSGRAAAIDALTGDGVGMLRSRLRG